MYVHTKGKTVKRLEDMLLHRLKWQIAAAQRERLKGCQATSGRLHGMYLVRAVYTLSGACALERVYHSHLCFSTEPYELWWQILPTCA